MIFLQMPRKDGLTKKNRTGIWPFLYYLERWFFFPGKYVIFSLDGKWKMIILKKYMEIWYFLYICIDVTNMMLPFCKKNQRWSSSKKTQLQVIDILDRILERIPTILYTFMETFIGVFIYCFPVKKPGNFIYRTKLWLLLQFICLKIFYNEEPSILCTIQPLGIAFRGVLERQLRKLFVIRRQVINITATVNIF